MPAQPDLDREHTAMFYRVAREAFANTLKHAHARSVQLSLARHGDRTVLLIEDDGRGFDPEVGARAGHLGMRIVQDTIHDAGGSLEVRSHPGRGTRVTASTGAPPR